MNRTRMWRIVETLGNNGERLGEALWSHFSNTLAPSCRLSNACMQRILHTKWNSPRVTIMPILNRYVSCTICCDGTRGVWVSRGTNIRTCRYIRSRRDPLKRDGLREKSREDGDEEGRSRMYRITRHTRPSPSPDSSRLVRYSATITWRI